jgi:hypothetical protein
MIPDPSHARPLRWLLLVALFIVVLGGYAHAQGTVCGPADQVQNVAASEFGAAPLLNFTNAHGTPFVMMVNPDNGYWVMFAHRGSLLCFIAEGNDFRPHEAPTTPGEPL